MSVLALLGSLSGVAQESYPYQMLSNQELKMRVYSPDAKFGFYRAKRFDWSGIIGSLKYNGHEFFDHWLEKHDPTNFESAPGPVDAFAPLGFSDARPGENFVIIGIGILQKTDDKDYHFTVDYPLIDPGHWKVKSEPDQVHFQQRVKSDITSYKYSKRIRLLNDQAAFVIEHKLINTGHKKIETTVYNHNFFVIDHVKSGPDISTIFPSAVMGEGQGFNDLIYTRENKLIFDRLIPKGESVYCGDIRTKGGSLPDYDFRIENRSAKVGVHVWSDRPLVKLAYWACHTTACPEPFTEINIDPGQSFSWNITYQFYEIDD